MYIQVVIHVIYARQLIIGRLERVATRPEAPVIDSGARGTGGCLLVPRQRAAANMSSVIEVADDAESKSIRILSSHLLSHL